MHKVVVLIIPILLLAIVPAASETNSLSVALDLPSEAVEGSVVALQLTITTDNLTDVSYELLATDGLFNNSLSACSDIIAVNGSITLLFYWTAPVPEQNLTVSFTGSVSADLLEDEAQKTMNIYTIEHSFSVSTTLSKDSLYQNESLVITVVLSDAVSTAPVINATVTLELELGTFVDGEITQRTSDASGTVTATASFSSLNLLFDSQSVSVTVSADKVKYATYEEVQNFTLFKIKPTATFTVSAGSLNIQEKQSVIFVITAYLNLQPWVNVTIKAVYTAGLVNDTANTFSGRTNIDGQVIFVWSSSNFPDLVENQLIDISINIVHADYSDLSAKEYQITVNAANAASTDFDTNDGAAPFFFAITPLLMCVYRRRQTKEIVL